MSRTEIVGTEYTTDNVGNKICDFCNKSKKKWTIKEIKNMKKHSNLGDEIFTIKKPDTSWHPVLVVAVVIIAACAGIYLFTSVAEILTK